MTLFEKSTRTPLFITVTIFNGRNQLTGTVIPLITLFQRQKTMLIFLENRRVDPHTYIGGLVRIHIRDWVKLIV